MHDTDTKLATGSLADLAREFLRESEESARAYLMQGWLSGAMGTLHAARRRAGLTQGEVAQRLGTTQSAVARLEKDHEGRCSLQRYVAYLVACEALPFEVETAQLADLRAYALADPAAPRTAEAYRDWCDTRAVADDVPAVGKRAPIPVRSRPEDRPRPYYGNEIAPPRRRRNWPSLRLIDGGLADPAGGTAASAPDVDSLPAAV